MSTGTSAGAAPPAPEGIRDDGTPASPGHVRHSTIGAHDHDVLMTAEGSRRLGVFVDFMRAAGLAGLLRGDGPFTILAPTERAFLKLSLRERDALLADQPRLTRVMRGHVIAENVTPPRTGALHVTTIDGNQLLLTSHDGTSRVGDVRIVQANIPASNGIIHAIDSVLL
jgi:uncharacterized surface protein with fasciclin (FAS1) repeats